MLKQLKDILDELEKPSSKEGGGGGGGGAEGGGSSLEQGRERLMRQLYGCVLQYRNVECGKVEIAANMLDIVSGGEGRGREGKGREGKEGREGA